MVRASSKAPTNKKNLTKKVKKQVTQDVSRILSKKRQSSRPKRQIPRSVPDRSGALVFNRKNAMGAMSNTTVDQPVRLFANELVSLTAGSGPLTFHNLALYVNPGNMQLFPVFSNIAQCYTSFRLISLTILFATENYQVSTGQSSGNVLVVCNYDPSESAFSRYKKAADYAGRMETTPFISDKFTMRKGTTFSKGFNDVLYKVFVSDNLPMPLGTANKTGSVNDYNVGLLQLIENNNINTNEIGKYYVSAEFEMFGLRQPEANFISPVVHARTVPTTSNMFASFTTIAGSSGSYSVTNSANNTLIIDGLADNTVISVNCMSASSSSYVAVPTLVTPTNCELINLFSGDTASSIASFTTTKYNITLGIKILSSPATLLFGAPVVAGTPTGDVLVTVLPSSLVGMHEHENQIKMNQSHQELLDRIEKLEIIRKEMEEFKEDVKRREESYFDGLNSEEEGVSRRHRTPTPLNDTEEEKSDLIIIDTPPITPPRLVRSRPKLFLTRTLGQSLAFLMCIMSLITIVSSSVPYAVTPTTIVVDYLTSPWELVSSGDCFGTNIPMANAFLPGGINTFTGSIQLLDLGIPPVFSVYAVPFHVAIFVVDNTVTPPQPPTTGECSSAEISYYDPSTLVFSDTYFMFRDGASGFDYLISESSSGKFSFTYNAPSTGNYIASILVYSTYQFGLYIDFNCVADNNDLQHVIVDTTLGRPLNVQIDGFSVVLPTNVLTVLAPVHVYNNATTILSTTQAFVPNTTLSDDRPTTGCGPVVPPGHDNPIAILQLVGTDTYIGVGGITVAVDHFGPDQDLLSHIYALPYTEIANSYKARVSMQCLLGQGQIQAVFRVTSMSECLGGAYSRAQWPTLAFQGTDTSASSIDTEFNFVAGSGDYMCFQGRTSGVSSGYGCCMSIMLSPGIPTTTADHVIVDHGSISITGTPDFHLTNAWVPVGGIASPTTAVLISGPVTATIAQAPGVNVNVQVQGSVPVAIDGQVDVKINSVKADLVVPVDVTNAVTISGNLVVNSTTTGPTYTTYQPHGPPAYYTYPLVTSP